MSETPQPDSPQAEANRAPVQPPLAQTSAARIEPVSSASATASRQAPPAMPAKEHFSKEYVAELRAESEAWQKKHQKALAELGKIKQDTQQQVTQTQQTARERIIRAEMKALAMGAGLRDLDGLKLADLSTVTLKDDDTLDGAAEMLVALKEAKPYLFTETERNTSPSRQPPAPKAAEPADVSQLPSEEYERSKHALLRAAMQKAVQSY